MHTDITTTIAATSKKEYREKLIKLFLKEDPGDDEYRNKISDGCKRYWAQISKDGTEVEDFV